MNVSKRIKRLFKLRFAILYPFGIYLIFRANSDDKSILSAAGFLVAGLFIRLWANGYAIKSEKLTTSGPYGFVRHPLYLGTMLLFIAFIVMLKIYIIGSAFFLVMAVVYARTIKKEELLLENNFKQVYLRYKKAVPAFLPALRPYREGEKWRFSFKRLIKSQEYKLFLWVIILVIAFHLKSEFVVEQESFDAKIWILIGIAFLLGISDLIGEVVKWKFNPLRAEIPNVLRDECRKASGRSPE